MCRFKAALERLAEADILLVQGVPPDSSYRFKHALMQDAAYEKLLKSRRQTLHRRVVEVLLEHFPWSLGVSAVRIRWNFSLSCDSRSWFGSRDVIR